MTIPTLKYICPSCQKVDYFHSKGPHYCHACTGKGSTHRQWIQSGPVKKVKKVKQTTGVRMIAAKHTSEN